MWAKSKKQTTTSNHLENTRKHTAQECIQTKIRIRTKMHIKYTRPWNAYTCTYIYLRPVYIYAHGCTRIRMQREGVQIKRHHITNGIPECCSDTRFLIGYRDVVAIPDF